MCQSYAKRLHDHTDNESIIVDFDGSKVSDFMYELHLLNLSTQIIAYASKTIDMVKFCNSV